MAWALSGARCADRVPVAADAPVVAPGDAGAWLAAAGPLRSGVRSFRGGLGRLGLRLCAEVRAEAPIPGPVAGLGVRVGVFGADAGACPRTACVEGCDADGDAGPRCAVDSGPAGGSGASAAVPGSRWRLQKTGGCSWRRAPQGWGRVAHHTRRGSRCGAVWAGWSVTRMRRCEDLAAPARRGRCRSSGGCGDSVFVRGCARCCERAEGVEGAARRSPPSRARVLCGGAGAAWPFTVAAASGLVLWPRFSAGRCDR